MLVQLNIRNLAVIEQISMQFSRGFHVLTGETGAGKSIVIDALSLIAGGRGSTELIRYGAEKAEIEALFELESGHPIWHTLAQLGIDAPDDEPLIIRREITAAGKSHARINGQLANLTMLREAGEWLINIHGQHEPQSLMRQDKHLEWLDAYKGAQLGELKKQYRQAFQTYRDKEAQLRQLQEQKQKTLDQMELYRFQMEEIRTANLQLGEDELLNTERRKLANAEKLLQSASAAYEFIYGANKGLESVSKAISELEAITAFNPAELTPMLEQIKSAYYQLEDAAFQLRDYREQIEYNPARLEQIEQRLDVIRTLTKKYGGQVEDVLHYLDKISTATADAANQDEHISELQTETMQSQQHMVKLALRLSELRRLAAKELADQVESELRSLHMERTKFAIELQTLTGAQQDVFVEGKPLHFTVHGIDEAEFLISANPGEPLRPLQKVASGGELSRIMLALKSIFARIDRIPVLVFDEVDTGVSGRAAQAIAEKMSRLSRICQVFSITHLSQVACMADEQYAIRKSVRDGRTYTDVIHLDEQGRKEELARMLGGVEVTETTLRHAREMMDLAEAKKIALLAEE